jgi:hypothetical protein
MEECREALAEYRTGNLKPMSAEEVIAELRCYLESDSVRERSITDCKDIPNC